MTVGGVTVNLKRNNQIKKARGTPLLSFAKLITTFAGVSVLSKDLYNKREKVILQIKRRLSYAKRSKDKVFRGGGRVV